MYFLKWLASALMRVLVIFICLVRLPFRLVGALCTAIDEMLTDCAQDARSACPWPWLPHFEKLWEEAADREKERLLRGLKDEAY